VSDLAKQVKAMSARDFAVLVAAVYERLRRPKARRYDCGRGLVPNCMGQAARGFCTCQETADAMMREAERYGR
jgi:hypothetical protein